MSEDFNHEVLERVSMGRRAFVKKLVLGTAFAIPVVASFNMLDSTRADARRPHRLTTPNATCGPGSEASVEACEDRRERAREGSGEDHGG